MRIKAITAILAVLAMGVFQGNAVAQPMQGWGMGGFQGGMPEGPLVIAMTDDLQFHPPQIQVPLGATVVWQNVGSLPHSVTDIPQAVAYRGDAVLPPGALPFDSGNISPGATFSYTFSVPGTYVYYCRHHELQGMVGQIVVLPQ